MTDPQTPKAKPFPFDEPAPDESSKHYAMFAAWRDLGPTRTLGGSDALDALAPLNRGRRPDVRNLRRLQKRHRWEDRARAYDAHVEALHSTVTAEIDVLRDIEDYRERQHRLAKALLEATIRLVTLANGRLATMKPTELRPQDVPRFFEVAAKVAAGASAAEAQTIGLAELLGVLTEQQEKSGWATNVGARVGSAPRAEA